MTYNDLVPFLGNKMPHNFDILPEVSESKINMKLQHLDVAGKEPKDNPLIQAHGMRHCLNGPHMIMLYQVAIRHFQDNVLLPETES
jgi:hypothetical protein